MMGRRPRQAAILLQSGEARRRSGNYEFSESNQIPDPNANFFWRALRVFAGFC
jgi:hypothetical protein